MNFAPLTLDAATAAFCDTLARRNGVSTLARAVACKADWRLAEEKLDGLGWHPFWQPDSAAEDGEVSYWLDVSRSSRRDYERLLRQAWADRASRRQARAA